VVNTTPEAVLKAATVLGIGSDASLNDIRTRYHEQIKKWHPDTSRDDPDESHRKTILMNEAYNLLVDYCMNYRFSFRKEDICNNIGKNPADFWMERFGNDPIWG
jgi:hypothetical protein